MKHVLLPVAAAMVACALSASAQTLPGAPENNGLTPKTATAFINGTNSINNTKTESLSIDLANNGNLIVGWEDDGSGLSDIESVWTLLDPNGNMITPQTVVSNRSDLGADATLEVTTNIFLSYYRSDNTSAPGYMGWGPKVKANRFGNGIGMGAMPWEIGLEVPELFEINMDAGGLAAGGDPAALSSSDDFACVQLLNNDGTPLRPGVINGVTNLGIVTFADADVQPQGSIRIGGWDYLSSGNILLVGESRQNDDWVLTGQTNGRTPVFRIVTSGGIQVKGYSAVSGIAVSGNISRNGAAVTGNGFAIRWQEDAGGGVKVRLFDNTGTPTTTNLDLAALTGHPEANGGGDGSDYGISSNGKDAYVVVGDYAIGGSNGVWVTVLNANGTVRWSKDVANDLAVNSTISGASAAIDESGQVIVVFSASPDPSLPKGIMGRRFTAAGSPVGGTFYVSETEIPDLSLPLVGASDSPQVAWRNGKIAIAWISRNYPDPSLAGTTVIAQRLFVASPLPGAPENNGLTPKTATSFVNGTNGVNNTKTEHLSVDIANNGNVIVGWEDDGSDMSDYEATWTLLDSNGNLITPETIVTNQSLLGAIGTYEAITNRYLSYFRSDQTPIGNYTGWGPKVKANRFGNGIGFGAMPWEIGLEIPELFEVNMDVGGGDDFACVQLLNNDGTPLRPGVINGVTNLGIVTFADADLEAKGAVRIGGWDYLSSGNILIVGESRQDVDTNLTGQASGNVPVYRIVTPGGLQVKGYSAVSSTPDAGNIARNGVGVTSNGFAIRWQGAGGANVRLFDNNGTPTTANVHLAALTGHPEAGGGGDGGNSELNGNGKDAYVVVGDYNVGGFGGFWVTVINANGTVRWNRDVSDDLSLVAGKTGTGAAAIDESGQVVVVFDAKITGYDANTSVTMGRRFDATGNPVGGTFYLSEKEVPDFATPPPPSDTPKVAWRNGNMAIMWISRSYPDPSLAGLKVIAQRFFQTGAPSLSISRSGSAVTISWPPSVTGFTLESSLSVAPGSTWTPVPGVVNNSVTVSNPAGNRFYRLKQ